ncbi:DnaB-like helicase C-terminal domain-containing protein [uncultured Friedmanniella sp.]|uniref:DnaB-like helicase C-terminal domain-containing protein n=1 Tax=uncultured Friedmanniella sp. TaxID=335381 RepID=UPI0035CA47E3
MSSMFESGFGPAPDENPWDVDGPVVELQVLSGEVEAPSGLGPSPITAAIAVAGRNPGEDVVFDHTGTLIARPSPEQQAIEQERNRRRAKEVVDAELATKVPMRTGRIKVRDLAAQAVAELEARREHGVVGLKTGVESFDKLAAPMFQPGRVIGVAASTKTGKTTILGQWLVNFAAQNIPTLVFTFEDEPTDTVNRWNSNVATGNIGDIRAGFIKDGVKEDVPEDYDKGMEYLSGLDIEVSPTQASCSQMGYEVGDWTQTWPAGTPAGVVVVDQLSHVVPDDPAAFKARFPGYTPPPHPDNTVKLLEWQTAMLQRIARRWNVMVILALQRNENDKDWEEPTVRSIRDSRGIVHKLDALVIPWRPERLVNPEPGPGQPETVPNTDERMWMCVPVARHIAGGFKVEVEWQGQHSRVADLGAGMGTKWQKPDAVSKEQLSGMAAYAEVKAKWQRYVDGVQDAANSGEKAPEAPAKLKSVGTVGAKWKLRVAQHRELESSGKGFGGGGGDAVRRNLDQAARESGLAF